MKRRIYTGNARREATVSIWRAAASLVVLGVLWGSVAVAEERLVWRDFETVVPEGWSAEERDFADWLRSHVVLMRARDEDAKILVAFFDAQDVDLEETTPSALLTSYLSSWMAEMKTSTSLTGWSCELEGVEEAAGMQTAGKTLPFELRACLGWSKKEKLLVLVMAWVGPDLSEALTPLDATAAVEAVMSGSGVRK